MQSIQRSTGKFLFYSILSLWLSASARAAAPAPFELRDGDRVVFLGDTFMEREQYHGWIELMLTTRYPERNVTFRNLGWSADTPAGDSRFGRSLLQAGLEPADEGWKQLIKQIEEASPTVVFVGYGMASSFDGLAGLAKFKSEYNRLLDTIEKISPGVRLVLVGPIAHDDASAWIHCASAAETLAHNQNLDRYRDAIREQGERRGARIISLEKLTGSSSIAWTDNGIHLTSYGYILAAQEIEKGLGWRSGAWGTIPGRNQFEPLRQAVLRKNEWFFHRSRPANMAYIFGFRKGEQGQNAVEIPKFDAYIAAEEARIAQLRTAKVGLRVPELPRRVGNLISKPTPQPLPKFEVAAGLEVTLWAENPLLNKPIQMNFDPQGRLWVASSEVYPQIEPGQAATDKIIVLEDTAGTGSANKATVFADGLLIPTGIEPGDGGCYVAQSTELLHFKDTNGDGKADSRRIVLSGFGTEDTHHNLHTLRWGFDGRLYMSQSIYTRTDTETPHGVVRLKGGGVFRFDPRDEQLAILYRGWVNAWGHQFDDFGQSFLTDGAGGGGINYGLPGASYVTAPKARRILDSVSPGSYPKFASIEIIRSQQFPPDWQGDMITCDFRAHRVVRFKISDQVAGYVTQEMPDVLRTTADSFRPIDVKMGPDGALYVADWSNPIIQHGEVDFRDPRRDKEHGRIWRIAAKGRAALAKVDFTKLKNPALLEKLVSPNHYETESARRVLVERGADKVRKDLNAWTKKQGAENARLQALWMYQAFNQPQPELLDALLAAHDAHIRAAATRVLSAWATPAYPSPPEMATEVALARLSQLITDENPRVRLEAVRALGKFNSALAADLAFNVLNQPMDPFLDYALWLTINELAEPWLAALKAGRWKVAGREAQLEYGLKAIQPALANDILGQLLGHQPLPRDGAGPWLELIGAAGGAPQLRLLFDQLLSGGFDDPASVRALAALTAAARLRNVRPEGDLAPLAALLKAKDESVRVAALQLAGTWKLAPFSPQLIQIANDLQTPPAERAAAFAALRNIGGSGIIADLKHLAGTAASPEIQREAVSTLAGLDFPAALPEILATLKATTQEAEALALWRALLGIRNAGAKLAPELPQSGLSPETARAGLRIAREGNQNSLLVPVLMQLAGLTLADKQMSAAELQTLAAEALSKGDAARGEKLYRRTDLACMTCHAIGGAGGKVGPDLTSIGASAPPDYLVESLFYPNAKIKEGFHSVVITMKDDQEFSGIVVKESDNEVILRNAANQEVSVAKNNIAKRVNGGSLMPSGLVDALLPEERLDLLKFLAQLGRPGEYDAAKGGTARSWKLYEITWRNEPFGVERTIRGDFTLKDWVPAFSLVNGALPKSACEKVFESPGDNTRGLFAATQFQSTKGGPVKFNLAGDVKGVWVNGQSVKAGAQFNAETKPGVNTLVVQLDGTHLPDPLKLSSGDVSFLTN